MDDILARLNRFEILGTEAGYRNTTDFLQFIRDAETGTKRKGLFDDRGPLAILMIVFLGGLALISRPASCR